MPETSSQIAFTHWPDVENMRVFFTARVRERMVNADTQVLKAVELLSGNIAGFVCWTLETGEEESLDLASLSIKKRDPTEHAIQQIPDFLNLEFVVTSGAEIKKLEQLMRGCNHCYVSTFVVAQQYQSQGIGTKLLRHCLSIADKNGLPTWLISFPGSHALYLRLLFEDVEHHDLDLAKWDKYRFRGFRVYRSHAMQRPAAISCAEN